LIFAAEKGHTDIAKSLISVGAKLDVEDGYQSTALSWAAREGRTEIANSLIAAGAKLDA